MRKYIIYNRTVLLHTFTILRKLLDEFQFVLKTYLLFVYCSLRWSES